jgi:hypothetical protein
MNPLKKLSARAGLKGMLLSVRATNLTKFCFGVKIQRPFLAQKHVFWPFHISSSILVRLWRDRPISCVLTNYVLSSGKILNIFNKTRIFCILFEVIDGGEGTIYKAE